VYALINYYLLTILLSSWLPWCCGICTNKPLFICIASRIWRAVCSGP